MKIENDAVVITIEELRNAIKNKTIIDLIYGIEASFVYIRAMKTIDELDRGDNL